MAGEGSFWNNWKGTALPASGSTVSNQQASGAYAGYKGKKEVSDVAIDPWIADLMDMSDPDRLVVANLLVKAGYLRTATSKYNKAFGDAYSKANQELQAEAARTGRPNLTLREFLLENVSTTGGAGGGAGGGPKADLSRSVYKYSPEQIDADINEVAQKILGREIVDADRQADWYKDLTKGLNKMISKGITTTTKLVKNKKTGKLEQVTTQTPEFTQEKAAETIESAVKAGDPISLARKQNLDFANWAFEKMGGRG